MSESKKFHEFCLRVDDDVYNALLDLKHRSNAPNLVELFRQALQNHEWIVEEIENGKEIISQQIVKKGKK